ncbi:MAG: tetratricopeptide repeat protein [Acidobacteriota bacterium]|nr:tetratricopeptide repeat protein [Blastocatellia bacterium]MDW8413098.1 tetratricopeptide repeat protein [Acidobacteriota bacterium]
MLLLLAILILQTGLDKDSETEKLKKEAEQLNEQVIQLYKAGKYDEAIPLIQRAIEIRTTILGPEHPDTAYSINDLAELYSAKGNYEQAEKLHKQALIIREKTLGLHHELTILSMMNLAKLFSMKGNYEQAEQYATQALRNCEEFLESIKNKPTHIKNIRNVKATALNELAVINYHRGFYSKSKAEALFQLAFQTALEIRQQHTPALSHQPNTTQTVRIDPAQLTAQLSNNLIAVCIARSDYTKAALYAAEAVKLYEQTFGKEHPQTGLLLNNVAMIFFNKGDYSKAEENYLAALEIYSKTFGMDNINTALVTKNLAALYIDRGDYIKAENFIQQTLNIYEKTLSKTHQDYILLLNNLAMLFHAQKQFDKANTLLSEALQLCRQSLGSEHPLTATVLNNLAYAIVHKADPDTAEPYATEAFEIRKRVLGDNHSETAIALNTLAAIYFKQGKYNKAEDTFKKALHIQEELVEADHPRTIRILNSLSTVYRAMGQLDQALAYKELADMHRENNLSIILKTGSERQKFEYLQLSSEELDQTISLNIVSLPNDLKATQLALTSILRRKGRALDAMIDAYSAIRSRGSKQDLEILNKLTDARAKYVTLTMNAQNKQQAKAMLQQIESLEEEISRRSIEVKLQTAPVTLTAVQQAIPQGTTLIEYIAYTQIDDKAQNRVRKYAAYCLDNTHSPKVIDLADRELIDAAVEQFRLALHDRKKDARPAAKQLYKLIFAPVQTLLGKHRRLLISPDAALNLVPFEALVDDHSKYLVQSYDISYLTSGRDLLRFTSRIQSESAPVIIADPEFGIGSGPRIGSEEFEPLQRLTGTAKEAGFLTQLLDTHKLLKGEAATKCALAEIRRPSLLHIATHGFFLYKQQTAQQSGSRLAVRKTQVKDPVNESNPLLLSGLFLAGANKSSDGVMTALEIAGLDLWGTALVVLSACDSGLGKIQEGEGVYGLRRALVLAGAQAQIISLWMVSDEGTSELMKLYYRNLFAGKDKLSSLRKARLALLRTKRYNHPYYWASFIYSGDIYSGNLTNFSKDTISSRF